MGVLAEYRSQGVGAALLGGLLAWAQIQPGLEKINLTVHGDNTRALGLYKKFGFEIEGIRKRDTRFEDDRYVDSVEMAKFLTET
jgi:RimJ/RimL family protein N-acetyltransferase